MKKLLTAVGLVAGIALSSAASATIIGGTVWGGSAYGQGGEFVDLGYSPSGLTVGNNNHQDPNLYAFDEDQNIVLDADLAIDEGGSSIAAGEQVASHYIFFDPAGGTTVTGWVDFDAEILGVITDTNKLDASDFLINNDVTYLNPNLRGLENNDNVFIDDSRLHVSFWASSPGDYIRVLTAYSPQANVPEPATAALLLLGMLGMSRKWKFATAKA